VRPVPVESFTVVMATGIVAVAARDNGHPLVRCVSRRRGLRSRADHRLAGGRADPYRPSRRPVATRSIEHAVVRRAQPRTRRHRQRLREPAEAVAYTGTALLDPVANYIGKYVNMWEMILRDKPMTGWLAMSKWADEAIPMPGAVYKQWVEAGSKDHLVFLPQAEAVMNLVGSEDKEFVVSEAGHVGLLTGRGARKGLWPRVRDWLAPRSS